MNILAIDTGTTCGFAYNLDTDEVVCESHELADPVSWGMLLRLSSFARNPFIDLPSLVVYEDASFQKGEAANKYQRQVAAIEIFCEKLDICYAGVPQSTLKKWIKDSGVLLAKAFPTKKAKKLGIKETIIHSKYQRTKENKRLILESARERSGVMVPDHNAADAWWLLNYVQNNLDEFGGISCD